MLGGIHCPNPLCRSKNIIVIDTAKKFSVGKSLVGGAIGTLFNPVGTIIGGATGINGKRGKTLFVCQKCGKKFNKKL